MKKKKAVKKAGKKPIKPEVLTPVVTDEDRAEDVYQAWKSNLEDILVVEEDDWETASSGLNRNFYYTSIDDPGEDAMTGTYRAIVKDGQVRVSEVKFRQEE